MKEHHIVVETLCRCVKERGIEQLVTCNDYDEAYETALALAERFNDTFCGRHGFDVVKTEEHFVISVEQGGFCEPCEI